MAYLTKSKLKQYLGIPNDITNEDTMFDDLIERVQAFIERYTARVFEKPTEPSVRKYNAKCDVHEHHRLLLLDHDLLSVESITNGDGNPILPEQYVLLPANFSPKYAIKLLWSGNSYWTWETDPEEAIQVEGFWCFSETVPPDVEHCMIRLCTYLYRQKDNAGEFDRTILAGNSTLLPTQIPRDILDYLAPYVRQF